MSHAAEFACHHVCMCSYCINYYCITFAATGIPVLADSVPCSRVTPNGKSSFDASCRESAANFKNLLMKKCTPQFINLFFAKTNPDLDHVCPQRPRHEALFSSIAFGYFSFVFDNLPIGKASHMYTCSMKTTAMDFCIVELIAVSTLMHRFAEIPVCDTGPCLLADVSDGTVYLHSSHGNMTCCYPFIDEIMKKPFFHMLQKLLTTEKLKKYKILHYSAHLQPLPQHNHHQTLSSFVYHPWTIAAADSSLNGLNHRYILSCSTHKSGVSPHSAIPTSHHSKSHDQSKMKVQGRLRLHCNGIEPKKPRQNTLSPNYHCNTTHVWECRMMASVIHLMLMLIHLMLMLSLLFIEDIHVSHSMNSILADLNTNHSHSCHKQWDKLYTCLTKKHRPQRLSCNESIHVFDLHEHNIDLISCDCSYDTNHSDNCHEQAAVNWLKCIGQGLQKFIGLLTCEIRFAFMALALVATMLWKRGLSSCHCYGKAYSWVHTILNTFDWFPLVVIYVQLWTMATAYLHSVNSSTHIALRTNYPGNCHNRSLVIGFDGGNALPWICTILTVIPAVMHYLKIKAFVYAHSVHHFCGSAHNSLKNTNFLGNFHRSLVIGCDCDNALPSHTILLCLILVLHTSVDTVISSTAVHPLSTIFGQPFGILIGPLFCLLIYQAILKRDTFCTRLTEWAAQLLHFVKNQYQSLKHYILIDLTPWLALYYSCHICICLAVTSNYQLQRKGLGIFHQYAVVLQVITLQKLIKERTEHLLSATVYINLDRVCNGFISSLSKFAAVNCKIIRWGLQIFYIMYSTSCSHCEVTLCEFNQIISTACCLCVVV